MLKAVLFDMDDTLLDWSGVTEHWIETERDRLKRVLAYLDDMGSPIRSVDLYLEEFRRLTAEAWVSARDTLRAPHMGEVLVEAAAALGVDAAVLDHQSVLDHYGWGAIRGTRLFPEVPEVLHLLRQHGVKLGIVTNAFQPMRLRDAELRALDLLDYFPDCRISAADVGYLKPRPEIFRVALDQLGVHPSETVFVGDNPEADIVGAQGVGVRAVLRLLPTLPFSSQMGLNGHIRPDGMIESLLELLPLLDEWYPGWRA